MEMRSDGWASVPYSAIMTNGEYYRSLTDDELASQPVIGRRFCDIARSLERCERYGGNCWKCTADWLREPSGHMQEVKT